MAAYFHSSDSEIISGYKRYSQQRNLDFFMALNLQKGCRGLWMGTANLSIHFNKWLPLEVENYLIYPSVRC